MNKFPLTIFALSALASAAAFSADVAPADVPAPDAETPAKENVSAASDSAQKNPAGKIRRRARDNSATPHTMTPDEAQMLKTLFLMSDDELARLRQMISRLEKTPPERRKRMAADLDRAMKATPEERRKMMSEAHERFRRAQENLLERHYATLSEKDANAEREKFLKLDREGKRKYIREIRAKLDVSAKQNASENAPAEKAEEGK